jgi:cytochrome c biogenesis protein CcmG/thiol:disulfide interchange protein DsbE
MDWTNEHDTGRWVDDQLTILEGFRDDGGRIQPDSLHAFARFNERRVRGGRRKGFAWAIAGMVVTWPLFALPSTRDFVQRCVSACVGEPSQFLKGHVFGSRSGATYVKPKSRTAAPDFLLKDASGSSVRLSDLRGKVVLLNFWATWCAPCRLEIPWFVEFQKTYRDRDFAILGVSLDEDGWNAVRPYVQMSNVNYTVATGNDDVARLYGANSLPTTLIIDRSGRVAARHVGICEKSEYESEIRRTLAEQ